MRRHRTAAAAALSALFLAALVLSGISLFRQKPRPHGRIGMAVEFNSHSAAAHVARDLGLYAERGLDPSIHDSYVSGMALASALAGNDFQAAYMCMVPAINARANAGLPIKIVAGTHKYGYALVANPRTVGSVEDLCLGRIRVGCVREGSPTDMLMNRVIDEYRLDRRTILGKVRRMDAPRLALAVRAGQLDAAFLPEHWAAMTEDFGFRVLLDAREVWPGMQGSVLVVKEDLLREDPDLVRKLVVVNEEATRWINAHPLEAAAVLSRALSVASGDASPAEAFMAGAPLDIRTETVARSMRRLEYSSAVSEDDVQEAIDCAFALGYIRKPFPAGEMLDTRFME